MSEPEDPVASTAERLRGHLTVALTAAARAAEVIATRRAGQLREAQRQSEAAARAAAEQLSAEATVARSQLRDVGSTDWWDRASPEEVTAAYATARTYGHTDPELAGTAHHLADEISRRYGVDAERLVADVEAGRRPAPADADPVAVRTAGRTEELDARVRQARAETAEAAALLTEADRVDAAMGADGVIDAHEAAHDLPFAQSGWDSASRREALAARLETALPDVPDAVTARTAADALHGRPAAAAPSAAQAARRAPKSRNTPVRATERTLGM